MRKVIKKKEPTLVDVAFMRILKEVSEKWVRMDVEMNDSLVNMLLAYADQNMNEEERKTLYINWAFIDIIKKQISRERQKK